MKIVKDMTKPDLRHEADDCWDILSDDGSDSWTVSLPPDLKDYQSELEALLHKVFSGRARASENFALAQQMSLNWCMSKCREVGISFEESLIGTTGREL